MAKKRKKKFWLLTKIFQAFFIVVFMACVVVAVGIYMKYGKDVLTLYASAQRIVEESTEKDFQATETSLVYDGKGDLLKTLKGEKDLYYLDSSAIPDAVKEALISIEDKKFYSHNGIDIKRIGGSLIANFRSGGVSQGASTITQQLSRTIYLNNDRTYTRKIKEIFIAIGLEKKYSKDQILEYYINNIYFGNGYYGIQAAANGYFRKSVSSLSLSQTAFLCAIPNGPSMFDPYYNKENTLKRRDLILGEMLKDGLIKQEEYDKAIAEKIKVKKAKKAKISSVDSFVMDCATKELMGEQGFEFKYSFDSDEDRAAYELNYSELYDQCESSLYTGGYRIYTSIDMEKQKQLQSAIDETLQNYTEVSDEGIYTLQSSATCIDNSSGRVIAIVGGREQKDVEGYSLNRAYQSYRQPGSSIKPLIVYTPVLERGYTPDSIVSDTQIKDEKDAPKNSNGTYSGRITLRKAVEQSKNVVAWRLFKELTPQIGLNYLKEMHYGKIVDSDYVLAAAVGGFTYGSNTKEMASGYATIANEGVYREPTCIVSITDSDGEIIVSEKTEEIKIYDENASRMMIDVMKGVFRGGNTGAGLGLSNNMPVAGKTGTTDDNKDGWFCGFSKYYTTTVWVGYDTPRTMQGLFGGTYPGRIWRAFMEQIHQGLTPQDWDDYKDEGKRKNNTEEFDATTESTTTENKDEDDNIDEDDDIDEDDLPVATEAPIVTEAPVTQAPVTEAPVIQTPVTEPPATQAPVVTEAPVAQ